MKRLIRRIILKRLIKVENLNIGRKEQYARRLFTICLITVLIWANVIGALAQTETVVYENVYAERASGTTHEESHIHRERHETSEGNTLSIRSGSDVSADMSTEEALVYKIARAFPRNTDEAVKIAICESQLSPDRIGDTNLVFAYEGELLGDSVGVFQIRTGGKENGKVWKRAPEGMTTAEYREKLKNPDYNLNEAKKIFEKSGWEPWTCKKVIQ